MFYTLFELLDREKCAEGLASVEGHYGEGSQQFGSHRHWGWSCKFVDRDSISPKGQRPQNAAMDAISRALRRAARLLFSGDIEQAPMPSRFLGLHLTLMMAK